MTENHLTRELLTALKNDFEVAFYTYEDETIEVKVCNEMVFNTMIISQFALEHSAQGADSLLADMIRKCCETVISFQNETREK